jgi:hypothetical protein
VAVIRCSVAQNSHRKVSLSISPSRQFKG